MADKPSFTVGRVILGQPERDNSPDVPEELARVLDESLDDLKHDRTSDVGEYLERLQKRIDAARAAERKSGLEM